MKTKTYEPIAGDHISDAAKESIELAKDGEVRFVFNELEIIVGQNDTVESVCDQYHEKSNKRIEEYRKSPEYKDRQRAATQNEKDQRKMDYLMLTLGRCKTDAQILNWFYTAIHLIDNIHVQVDRQIIKDYLINLGYEENWGLNQPKEFYKNKSNFARYIIGQVINCWHPLVTNFIDDWRKLD